MSTSTKRIATVAVLAVTGFVIAACNGVGRPESAQGGAATGSDGSALGITVTGLGSVKAAPDQATFSFGVETQGATANEALAANNEAVQKVIDAVKGEGIPDEDIQTQSVSVTPRYSSDGQVIIGYSAINTINAIVRDLDQVGAVVDAATAAGANQVYGPTLDIADKTAIYEQALGEAFDDARSKAEAVAKAAGVTLGGVVNVVEGGGYAPLPAAERAAAADAGGVPIEPGLQELQASLAVTFAIS